MIPVSPLHARDPYRTQFRTSAAPNFSEFLLAGPNSSIFLSYFLYYVYLLFYLPLLLVHQQ